jgi:hypothetical protein
MQVDGFSGVQPSLHLASAWQAGVGNRILQYETEFQLTQKKNIKPTF